MRARDTVPHAAAERQRVVQIVIDLHIIIMSAVSTLNDNFKVISLCSCYYSINLFLS